MAIREDVNGFVLEYVSSYPDESFHGECVNALLAIVEKHVAEQRKMCADDAFNQSQLLGNPRVVSEAISDACLNATGDINEILSTTSSKRAGRS